MNATTPPWTAARIERSEDLTADIRLFELSIPGGALPWQAGAHLPVQVVADGRPETRRYSLIDLGHADGRYRIAVKRMDQGMGGSRHMWSLEAGDELPVGRPGNHFPAGFTAAAYTLVAGGIGITPLIAMARQLRRLGKPVALHYAVRSRADAAFADELRALLGADFHLYPADEGQRLDLAALAAAVPAAGELYVCGPLAMLDGARQAWAAAGQCPGRLRFETFASSGRHANQAFTVNIPRLGLNLEVPAHQTLLSALEQAGVDVMSDCRRGECGLCALDVLGCNSPIDHRDVFFSDAQKAENRKLCACVSRPAGGQLTVDTAYRGAELPAAA